MRAIWKGDVKNLTDIMAFQMILDNAHTWATRVFKPTIASYIEQWKHIHREQRTVTMTDLLQTSESHALRERNIEQRKLVAPLVRDLLDAHTGMELDDMTYKKVTPLFLGMLMHQICSMERTLISSQIEKAVTERLQVIVANGPTVTTKVEAVHRVEATAKLPIRGHHDETAQTASSNQESEMEELDDDDPHDSDYNPTNSESRSRSPSDAPLYDGDTRSEVAVSVASTSAFSLRSFSEDTTVLWKHLSDPETPKAGTSSKKGSERPGILDRQSLQLSDGSDDETPKPSTAGRKLDFSFSSQISGSPLERLGGNSLDGSPVFAGRSPPSETKWPRGQMFDPPKTQESPMHRSGISPSPLANAKAEECIDLTTDNQADPSNTDE